MPGFPELYFGINQPGRNPFPTEESDWKKFDIGFGKIVHDLAVGYLTEEQEGIARVLEEETGYAEISRKYFEEGLKANAESVYRQNSPIIEAAKKSNKKNYSRLPIESIKSVVSRLRGSKSKK